MTQVNNKIGATSKSAYTYTINDLGQRTDLAVSRTEVSRGWNVEYLYNGNREVAVANHDLSDAYNRAYYYDEIGNRQWEGSGNSDYDVLPTSTPPTYSTTYDSNKANEYTDIGGDTPIYDDDGKLTDDDSAYKYTWDAENRLIELRNQSNTLLATYTYDYLGRRVRKVTEGAATGGARDLKFVYEGWNLIAEFDVDASFSLERTYVWGLDVSGSTQGAGGVGGLLAIKDYSSGTATYYPAYDGNGNLSQVFNSSGTVVSRYEYDPFGNTVAISGTYDSPMRFSTKYYDVESGLYYYGFRYYDPVTGRWLNRDPIGEEGGWNLYAFVGNQVSMFVDVLGLAQLVIDKGCEGHEDLYKDWSYIAEKEPLESDGTRGSVALRRLPNPGHWVLADAVYLSSGSAVELPDLSIARVRCWCRREGFFKKVWYVTFEWEDFNISPIKEAIEAVTGKETDSVVWKEGENLPDGTAWPGGQARPHPYKGAPPVPLKPALDPSKIGFIHGLNLWRSFSPNRFLN